MPHEQKAVAELPDRDPWSGALGPKIKPEKIAKTWRHDEDPNRRRATFGVPYPLLEITIEKTDDLHTKLPTRFETTRRRSIQGVRLRLQASNLTFWDADFYACKFHSPDSQGDSHIKTATFKNCSFDHTFLGGTAFRHVTFDNCRFSRCDFGDSQLIESQFFDCSFSECTAESTSFHATEIDPSAFLAGVPPPSYNFAGAVADGEVTLAQVTDDWVEVRRKLAAQLLRSNTDIHNTANADQALFELKRAEVRARVHMLRTRPLKMGLARLPLRAAQVFAAWLILHATKGGTSLGRLFLGGIIAVPTYALLLSHSHVTFMSQDCHLHSLTPSLVMQQISRAASLFLAIGYTAFSGGILATFMLTVGAVVGLLWYALVAAVVIHRVYR